MDGEKFQAGRGYKLDPPGHPHGVSCDAQGPALGPIQLLVKTDAGFVVRPVEELNEIFSQTFGRPMDCTSLLPGLRTIAGALNDGNLARAMIATQLLHLPYLDETEAVRAASAEAMSKASVNDPKHPGWAAGTQGSLGGKFRPKNGEIGEAAKKAVEGRLRRLVLRRAIRAALRRLMTWRRLLRLGGEAASNVVPGLDVVGDAAMVVDLANATEELATLKSDADVALEFAKKGPYSLDELRVSSEDEAFPSFSAFKKIDLFKRFPPAGPGMEYHHIVEQSAEGDIPASELNSTRNIVRIPKLVHEEISSEYAQTSTDAENTAPFRMSLKGKSFEERWEAGLRTMRELGILH
jgi:hypothetical protein